MTGLTPECRPATSVTKTPSPASRSSCSKPAAAGADDQVRGGDRGRRAVAGAARVAGRGGFAAARGVGVVEVGPQPAALDQRGAPPRRPLGVDRRRGEPLRLEPVVAQHEGLAGDLLAEPPGERRAAALHRVGAQRPAEQADEAGGDGRVEDDRAAARLGLARRRSSRPRGAPPRAPIASGSSPAGPRPRPKPSPVSRPVLALGQRLEVGVAAGRSRTRRRRRSSRRSRPARRCRSRPPARPRPRAGRPPARPARPPGPARRRAPVGHSPSEGSLSPASAGASPAARRRRRRTRPRRRPAAPPTARAAIAATPSAERSVPKP